MRISSFRRFVAVVLGAVLLGVIGQFIDFLTRVLATIPGPLLFLFAGMLMGVIANLLFGHFSKKQEANHD